MRCLGKLPPKLDHRTFKLSRYLKKAMPAPPSSCDWGAAVKVSWGMMLNDRIGNCGIAAPAHGVMSWTASNGGLIVPTDQQILQEYEAVSGYDPGTGANDNGVSMLDVCNRWRQVGLFGRQIGAFAAVNLHDPNEVATAIWLFGGIYLGLALPEKAQEYIDAGKPWLAPTNHNALWGGWQPGSWGGHAVWSHRYGGGMFHCVTWGEDQPYSPNFLSCYADEGYATVSPDWLGKGGKAPSGFDAQALTADLQAL